MFTIDKTVAELRETWDLLESGKLKYTDPERAGLVHKPIAKQQLRFIRILHQMLRSLDHVLKILYHIVAGREVWSEVGVEIRQDLKQAKKTVIDHIRVSIEFFYILLYKKHMFRDPKFSSAFMT